MERARFTTNWPRRYAPYARPTTLARVYAVPGGRRRLGERARRRAVTSGYVRRVGLYGRFGTGRSNNAQVEKKFADSQLALTATTGLVSTSRATGAFNLVIPQDSSANGRIGQKVVIKSIQVKANVTLAAGAVDTDIHHLWIIQDTQANGTFPAVADVFVSAGGNIGTWMRNVENGNRFRILKHFVTRLNADAGVATAFGGDIQPIECFVKCNIPITYNDAPGAIGSIKSNNIFCLYGSQQGATGATVAGFARVRYTDK